MASDPDGDALINAVAVSDNGGVVAAFSGAPGVVTLSALAPGAANVTVSVEDGRGGYAATVFGVTVEQPNRNPVIEPIAGVTLSVGETREVYYVASDPDGDALINPVAISDNGGVVAAYSGAPGVVTLSALAPGAANVTVSVEDGRGGYAAMVFGVTVEQPNRNPVIEPIAGVMLNVGETREVYYVASDPDGDALINPVAISDNGGVVAAFSGAPGVVTLSALAPGVANVTVSVEDGRGGYAATVFGVTVEQPNRNPVIEPIAGVMLNVGETREVYYVASDPDGDALINPVAISDNGGVVAAFSGAPGVVTLSAVAPGTANVTVSVEDGRGGYAATVFGVTVNPPPEVPTDTPVPPPPPGEVDLDALPNVSPVEGDVLKTARDLYGRGLNQGMNPGVFSVVGDTPPAEFLGDFADGQGDFGTLKDAAELSEVVFYYSSTPLPTGRNSFDGGGALASDPNWRAGDLLNPALASGNFCAGETPLACELRVNRPAVVFVVIGRNDVLGGTPVDQFEAQVEEIVRTIAGGGRDPGADDDPRSAGSVPDAQCLQQRHCTPGRALPSATDQLLAAYSAQPGRGGRRRYAAPDIAGG
ncbi:MAG: hypothetical protein KatS3mg051_1137 [Anaerolineae bacterium]|nr:MAG: hypothetical protein KatS3mg051_1137 [Anaerolineae bacterium]